MTKTLAQWLDYQLSTHPQAIAMGLERVKTVAERLGLTKLPCQVITVAGTNGKGSTVAFIEAIASASGYKVGAFTSPHFIRYNERIRIAGQDVSDQLLIEAFEAIEQARVEIPLTYFEFGTLAALFIFARSKLDVAVLEVGLGGRLDAVNIIDADVSVITTVDIDHQAYLGSDRESIGFEKAGIMRSGKPCILGEKDPPSSVLKYAYEQGVYCVRGFSDYLIDLSGNNWVWREPGFQLELPYPSLSAPVQVQNAACAIAALRASSLEINTKAWAKGVQNAKIIGRMQCWQSNPEIILDVAHNAQSVEQLANWLAQNPKPTSAVFCALKDKDIAAMIVQMQPYITHWYVGELSEPAERVCSIAELLTIFSTQLKDTDYSIFDSVASAFIDAKQNQVVGSRILVFGSFHTLEAIMKLPQ